MALLGTVFHGGAALASLPGSDQALCTAFFAHIEEESDASLLHILGLLGHFLFACLASLKRAGQFVDPFSKDVNAGISDRVSAVLQSYVVPLQATIEKRWAAVTPLTNVDMCETSSPSLSCHSHTIHSAQGRGRRRCKRRNRERKRSARAHAAPSRLARFPCRGALQGPFFDWPGICSKDALAPRLAGRASCTNCLQQGAAGLCRVSRDCDRHSRSCSQQLHLSEGHKRSALAHSPSYRHRDWSDLCAGIRQGRVCGAGDDRCSSGPGGFPRGRLELSLPQQHPAAPQAGRPANASDYFA